MWLPLALSLEPAAATRVRGRRSDLGIVVAALAAAVDARAAAGEEEDNGGEQ